MSISSASGIPCRLIYDSDSRHLEQLYTGFAMLHRNGRIRLTQQKRRAPIHYGIEAPHLRDAKHAHLGVIVGSELRLHFDTHDAREVALSELETCDFYFKRSFAREYVESLPANLRAKIHPLGLNYYVLPDFADPAAASRSIRLHGASRAAWSGIVRALDTGNRRGFKPRLSHMQSSASVAACAPAKVLFMVAAYDPHDDADRSDDKVRDRIELNAMRAQCIRLLRSELGEHFLGGFQHNDYSRREFPDLLADPSLTTPERYLQCVRSHAICIASAGLHDSTGWKFAEYLAFARAVVCERMAFEAPGPLHAQQNYLEFATPAQCLEGARSLMNNELERIAMMKRNAAYYEAYVRPDALVWQALEIARSGGRGAPNLNSSPASH